MAKFNSGKNFFALRGTIGKLVFATWRGKPYVRSKPRRRVDKPTPAQLEHRARFALGMNMVSAMESVFEIGYRNVLPEKTPYNHAISQIMNNAIVGEAADLRIDYSRMLISSGKLPNVENATAVSMEGSIIFNWGDNTGTGSAKSSDRILLAVWCEELNDCIFITDAAFRKSKTARLPVDDFTGKKVQTFISCISPNGKKTAISSYTGEIMIE